MFKRTRLRSPKPKKLPYSLRDSVLDLFNRASVDLPSSSAQSDNSEIKSAVSVNSRSSSDSSVLSSQNMTEPPSNQNLAASATQVFNSLKIPDAVKDLPKFDGNPKLLYDFIENVEEILCLVSTIDGTLYGKILLRAIRNKIEGPANEVLNMYGTPLEWEHIKKNLILHYSDKRNETSLIRDLHSVKQFNKSIEKYYSEIIELQATMFNHIQIHEKDHSVIKAKKDLYSEMCLNTFLTGLKEPLGSTIRAMRPESLPVAFSYCIKEQNISYAKNEQSHSQNKPNSKFSRPFGRQQPINFPSLRQLPSQQPQYRSIFNQRPQETPYQGPNQQFNSQQRQNTPFSQPRPFGPNPFYRPNLPKPEPMDTSSGHTHLRQQTRYQPPRPPTNNFAQQNRQPNFISKELFNIDEWNSQQEIDKNIYPNDSYYANLDRYYNNQNNYPQQEVNYVQNNDTRNDQSPELDDTNFHIAGLMSPSDT